MIKLLIMNNIAISANTSWYLYNFRKNTIKALLKNGYNVYAIAPIDEYSSKLECLGVKYIDIFIDQGGTNPFLDIKTIVAFRRILLRNNIAVLLNFTPKNNIYGAIAAATCGVKVINNVAGLGTLFVNNGFTLKIAILLYRFSLSFVDKVFFQNAEDRDLFINKKLVDSEITDILPGSGADLTRFSVCPASDDGTIRFLLVARMLYEKGIQHYVEAARFLKAKYPNILEFRLLGFLDVNNPSAVTKEQMNIWSEEGSIIYLGVSDYVEYEISQVDCVVLPSYYREGVPKSLLEAGAMGKMLVTTNNVGCRETVEHGVNGYLCEPRSTASLIEKLELVINLSHQQRLAMGNASRLKIEKEFDESIVISKYISTIKNLLIQ